tara:strand:+ start:670 stop:990 length:321 start_codon:yes stop_codon:yes gene_type:complete
MISFVSEKDISELTKNGINYDEDIKVFINEMKGYLYQTWDIFYHKYIDKMTNNTIEELNILISNYPSHEGSQILSNSFECVSDEDLDILSEKTLYILGYFYNIHLY